MTTADPTAVHSHVLESLAELELGVEMEAEAVAAVDAHGPQRLANVRAMLAGRRRVLERHAPHTMVVSAGNTVIATGRTPMCAYCRRPWPCDDYTDTAAGISDFYGDTPPGGTP